ncbi:hypothetical protein PMIN06_007298 [Paraphaeosphaeria minitans]
MATIYLTKGSLPLSEGQHAQRARHGMARTLELHEDEAAGAWDCCMLSHSAEREWAFGTMRAVQRRSAGSSAPHSGRPDSWAEHASGVACMASEILSVRKQARVGTRAVPHSRT